MQLGAQHPPVRKTIALVLAGGRGSRLYALTDHCAKSWWTKAAMCSPTPPLAMTPKPTHGVSTAVRAAQFW